MESSNNLPPHFSKLDYGAVYRCAIVVPTWKNTFAIFASQKFFSPPSPLQNSLRRAYLVIEKEDEPANVLVPDAHIYIVSSEKSSKKDNPSKNEQDFIWKNKVTPNRRK